MNNLVLTGLMVGRSNNTPLNLKIDFSFEVGKFYYLHGNNGCGKTTLMRTICGYLQPLNGNVSLNETSSHTAYYGHDDALKARMTVFEYLSFCKNIFDSTSDLRPLIDLFHINDLLNVPLSYLSCGQKKRASLVGFLICNRDIYCLDEASSGLDCNFKAIFYNYIRDLAIVKKKIVIFSDHVNPNLEYQNNINLHDFQYQFISKE